MQVDSSIAAVVTGGASGLGEAVARRLAAEGVRVALFDLNEARGQIVARDIGGVFCLVDITSDSSVNEGLARARHVHGQERVLINCAGIVAGAKTASRDRETGQPRHHPLDLFSKVIQVNLIGSFRCASKSAAGMMELEPLQDGERGVIINTASVAAEDGQIGQAAYAASKAGVVGMTLPMARDLAGEGIRVNTILPGTFGTPMMGNMPQAVRDGLAAVVPFPKRLGEPEEFASLVLELCRNAYLNASTIRIDGAVRMPPR
jgi:NAD(P)-dependent dehydrogenase (short-subunit alcohol dehydrogenase family)